MRKWKNSDAILFGGTTARSVCNALLCREIRVTKQMIRDGHKKECRTCPVALALKEELSQAGLPDADVRADVDFIQVDGVRFGTPDIVTRFMNRFDYTTNRESMSGFRFTLTETLEFYAKTT